VDRLSEQHTGNHAHQNGRGLILAEVLQGFHQGADFEKALRVLTRFLRVSLAITRPPARTVS